MNPEIHAIRRIMGTSSSDTPVTGRYPNDDYRREWKLERGYYGLGADYRLVVFDDDRCDWWERERLAWERGMEDMPRSEFAWKRVMDLPVFRSRGRLTLEEVKERMDIVELVGQFTELRGHGDKLMGRCPLHDERNPSFSVDRKKGLWHCFSGCGGGDGISFIQRKYGKSFVEALDIARELIG